jgi:hydroxymethylpyrimidine pyrophosphatase-like HAD family hydrolase/energy-coupling factor transporter ATP-binding protein EcfA2
MHILALAVDYDGTIAKNGFVTRETVEAMLRLKKTGKKLLLVTGRQLIDLQRVCTDLGIFDYIVAENGAVLHDPASGSTEIVAAPPSSQLIERLTSQSPIPLAVGQSIIATWHPHEHAVINAIHDLGLELQLIFNKDAVMILPVNVNKATGLASALRELDISPLSVAGCGDAENDLSFLAACGCSAAVANALPSLKSAVDMVLDHDHGDGVIEFIERIMSEDDRMLPLGRRGVVAGTNPDGEPFYLRPEDVVLVVGNSGSGKSSYLTLLSERIAAKGYEFCIIDPEGDYLSLEDAATIGGLDTPPGTEEAVRLLFKANINVVVNAMNLNLDSRKRLFTDLMPTIRGLRERSGRPQWLIIDEAHYILPYSDKVTESDTLSKSGAIIATVNPDSIGVGVLRQVDIVVAMGATGRQLIRQVANLLGLAPPMNIPHPQPGEFLIWSVRRDSAAAEIQMIRQQPAKQIHSRHSGKYALGDVGQQRSFYFPDIGRHARNLKEFLQISAEIGEESWLRHLRAGDYSAWFRNVIRDDALADRARELERDQNANASEGLALISRVIRDRYLIGN